MSIFSAIGSGISKAVSAVKNVFTGGNSNTASAGMVFPVGQGLSPAATLAANNAILTAGGNKPVFQTPLPANYSPGSPGSTQFQTPLPANYSPNILSSKTISSGPTNSPTVSNSSIDVTPQFSATSLSSGTSSPSVGGTTPGTPSNAFPSAPGYSNPGTVNNGGLVSSLASTHTYDAKTNQFVANPAPTLTPEEVLANQRKATLENLMDKAPKKEDILSNSTVVNAQSELDAQKKLVTDYTSQLNSIVAKQNADLLRLRSVGSQNGVTEAVYGGQEAEINREAAIQALPVQAQIAAAQGNEKLAQDYLSTVTKIISENVDNNYNYNKSRFDYAAQYAIGEDKIKLEALNKQNDRAYAEKKDNINFAQSLITKYADQPGIVSSVASLLRNPDSSTFATDLYKIAGTVTKISNAEKPAMTGQTLDLGSNAKDSQKIAKELETTAGITSQDIVSLQKYLGQGYSLEQIAKLTGMPATIQSAFAKYINVPKLGESLPKNQTP